MVVRRETRDGVVGYRFETLDPGSLDAVVTGVDLERSVWCKQVHADNVVVVEAKDAGRGAFDEDDIVPDADALVTNSAGIALCVTLADCVPVIVHDRYGESWGLPMPDGEEPSRASLRGWSR